MLKEPSTIKRKRRSSSLTRQNFVGLLPSRSRTFPRGQSDTTEVTKEPPPKTESKPAGDDTLKRKPKRPAPTLPPPHKQASVKGRAAEPPGQVPRKSEPPELTKQAPPQPARVAPSMAPAKTYGLKRPAPEKPARTPETYRKDSSSNLLSTPSEGGQDVSGRHIPLGATFAGLEPLGAKNSGLDATLHPEGMDDDGLDESMFEGGMETLPDAGEDQDFILEPPDDFSQLSVGELDDNDGVEAPLVTGKDETGEKGSSLGMQFSNPAALEGMDEDDGVFPDAYGHGQGESWLGNGSGKRREKKGEIGRKENAEDEHPSMATSRQSSTEHRSSKSKKSKKKRESRGDSEAGSRKHKSKKKKRQSASTDELLQQGDTGEFVLPEYEFDRGLDRVPMRSSKENLDSDQSRQRPTWSHSAFKTYSQEDPTSSKGASKSHVSSSYDNMEADDDYSPPWLHDGNPSQSQELSFEELDAYAEDDEQDEPRVVYKEDVAAMVW